MITEQQIINIQNQWGAGVVKIGTLRNNRTECKTFASEFLDKHYCFGKSAVLFKPTKCAQQQFRPTNNNELETSDWKLGYEDDWPVEKAYSS